MECDRIWRNARLATMAAARGGLGMIEGGIVASAGGRIAYAGPADGAPSLSAAEDIDCDGRLITPGLVDCHTHLVYAGDRAAEWQQRLEGATYEQIARAGGGIRATVRATRAASPAALLNAARARLDALVREGVTTVEIKSGYGLTLADEIKCLAVARDLEPACAARVTATFLAAHAVPPEFDGRADAYVSEICNAMLPEIVRLGLADAVDVFCETIAFSPDQTRRVFEAARALGLPIKVHAEQLSNCGGAALAASFGALSADHLEHLDDIGVAALAGAGTVAVLLPGAFYFTRDTSLPPIEQLRARRVPIALATDCNPGTSPLTSPLLCMNMGATLFSLTVPECLLGMTREAARALGRLDEIGTLEAGKSCDLAIWNVESPAVLLYHLGRNPLYMRVFKGR